MACDTVSGAARFAFEPAVSTLSRMASSEVYVALKMSAERQQRAAHRLRAAGFEPRFVGAPELVEQLGNIEYLILGRPPVIDWSSARRLRLIHVAGAGVDPLFPAHGLRPEVTVTNSRGAHAELVRDHVLALLLALYRDLPRAFEQQANRQWQSYPAVSVSGQTLCVVGLGEIGARVALAGDALGMRVTGVARTARPVPGVSRVLPVTQLTEAVTTADAIVICVPLTSQTRHLFDANLLERLRTGVRLVNVSRGAVIDERALEMALRAGRLTAALDVFETEPLAETSSLWRCPGLIVSPHLAGFAAEYLDAVVDKFVGATEALSRGETPAAVVSREHEY